jgi:hypothetical protein
MKKHHFKILFILLLSLNLHALDVLSNKDIERYLIFSIADKKFNQSKKIKIKIDLEIKCINGKETTCYFNNILLSNKNFNKLFHQLKIKKVSIQFKPIKKETEKIKNQSKKKYEDFLKSNTFKNLNEKEKRKYKRRKNITIMDFQNFIYLKKFQKKIKSITFNNVKGFLENGLMELKIAYKINFKNQVLIINRLYTQFLNEYIKKQLSYKIKIFKKTTNLKGLDKIIKKRELENAKGSIIYIIQKFIGNKKYIKYIKWDMKNNIIQIKSDIHFITFQIEEKNIKIIEKDENIKFVLKDNEKSLHVFKEIALDFLKKIRKEKKQIQIRE